MRMLASFAVVVMIFFAGCRKSAPDFTVSSSHIEFLGRTKSMSTDLDSLARQLGFKQASYPYYVPSDGCSGKISRQGNQRFNRACVKHDLCYRIGENTREECDNIFLRSMQAKCSELSLPFQYPCLSEAQVLFSAVGVRSPELFENRRNNQARYESTLLTTISEKHLK